MFTNPPVKLIKIRFTSWRDQNVAPRTSAFQKRIDACTSREVALRAAAARVKSDPAQADTDVQQKLLGRIAADLDKLDAERTFLVSAEESAAEAETRAATEHAKVGTFGYQVVKEPDYRVTMVVDETGEYLPEQALYTFEVVDTDPPLPAWAKDGKFRH